jgi:integrase
MEKQRGDGWIYQRGNIWWIQYSNRGNVFRESSKSTEEKDAQRLLRKRLGEISGGVFKSPQVERTKFQDLKNDIVMEYQVNNRKSIVRLKQLLAHLETGFERDKAIEITTPRINQYIVMRQTDNASNAEINRELSVLKRMFSLGIQSGKVSGKPYIPSLTESKPRQGFFEHDDFIKLRKNLPEHIRPLITFAHTTGWRSEEIKSLRWNQVDLKNGSARLEAGTTKNGEGRTVFLTKEIQDLLSDLWSKRRLDCPWVFNKGGKKIGSFRKAWTTACKKTGLEGMLFHDFRRTAIRNLVRAGVPERVAMMISGHKNRNVFDRYNIVSENDLKEAASKIAKYTATQGGAKILSFQAKTD